MGKRRIGILTSGGDCAGLNAALRAATLHAVNSYGWDVTGIYKGTAGLLEEPPQAQDLTSEMFDGTIMRRGGTILGSTNKGNPFDYPMPDGSRKDRSTEMLAGLHTLGIDALIGVGGDGSLAILRKLTRQGGMPFIGIPKTIDNDIGATENAIGYASAVSMAVEALDSLQPTAASHDRLMILEVMGRDAGHIALNAGIAGGADVILIPEVDYTLDAVAAKIEKVKASGRNFALMVVAEAVPSPDGEAVRQAHGTYGGIGHLLGSRLEEMTGFETRCPTP